MSDGQGTGLAADPTGRGRGNQRWRRRRAADRFGEGRDPGGPGRGASHPLIYARVQSGAAQRLGTLYVPHRY